MKIKGWDDTAAEKATQPFGPLPAGDYIVEIVDATDKKITSATSEKGTIRRSHDFKVIESFDGENEGREVKYQGVLLTPTFKKSGKPNGWFYQLHKALGAEPGEFPDSDEVIGSEIGVTLGYAPRDSKGRVFNESRAFFVPGSKELKARDEAEPPAGDDADGPVPTQADDEEFQIP